MPLRNDYLAPSRWQAPDPYTGSGYYSGSNGAYNGYDDYDEFDVEDPEGIGRPLLAAIVSALLPGIGHAMAGRRRTGRVLLSAMFLLVTTLGIAYVGLGRSGIAGISVDVDALTWIFVGTIVLGLAWAATIVSAFLVNRPAFMTGAQRFAATFIVGILCLVVLAPAAIAAYYTNLQRDTITTIFTSGPEAKPNFFADKPRVNILLLGSDAAEGRDSVRTDSMIVSSIDTRTGRSVLFSLPRNLRNAPFPDGSPAGAAFPNGFDCGSECLLNAVYRYGDEHPDLTPDVSNHGAALLEQSIEATLGLEIDYYIIIDLKGFEGVINALGGIRVIVREENGRPIPIGGERNPDGSVKRQPSGELPVGKVTLDGRQALWYARSRFYSDDYHRMERQRCVLGAIARQATPVNVLKGYQGLTKSAKNSVETDLPEEAFQSLVELAANGKTAKITSVSFDNRVIKSDDPDFGEIRQIVVNAINQAIEDSEPTPTPSTSGSGSPATQGPEQPGSPESSSTPTPEPGEARSVDEVCEYW